VIAATVPSRPFATEQITGLMLPDGIFESSIGNQRINAFVQNTSGATLAGAQVYVESVSHPGIVVTPQTHAVPSLAPGASRQFSWPIDVSAAPPGSHLVSFVIKTAGDQTRVIKKIFVTRVSFDPSTVTFHAETPEGEIAVQFSDLVGPGEGCCPPDDRRRADDVRQGDFIEFAGTAFAGQQDDFRFCVDGYLPHYFSVSLTPNPPYEGQYGDLPFQDPWWKVVLCIIAVILLIAAGIVAATGGGGSVSVSTGSTPTGSPVPDCCGVRASGGSSSYVVAGLTAAAAAAATAAALSDERDPFRRGQDQTPPGVGEITLNETLEAELDYIEPVALGKPFKVGVTWTYKRTTTGGSYTHTSTDVNENVHVVSRYEIEAPDTVRTYQKAPFDVHARFFDAEGNLYRGNQLFVQCILAGPNGESRRFLLQDDGEEIDKEADDDTYSGRHWFRPERDHGLWLFYVIAQDVNHAQPDMDPEEAAQIIGGFVVTHQLTISFNGGTCDFVPDGHVQVL